MGGGAVEALFSVEMLEYIVCMASRASHQSDAILAHTLMKLFMMKQPMLAFSRCFASQQQNVRSSLFDLA